MAIKLQGTNSAAAPGLTNDGGDGVVVGTDTVDISIGGASKVHVTNAGRVGLGNTSPNAYCTLDVTNTAASKYGIINTNSAGNPIFGTYATGSQHGQLYLYKATDYGNSTQTILLDTNGASQIKGGSLELGGNLIVPNGSGIDFSATSDNAGKTSELLDDYEEGLFTPTWVGVTQNSSYEVWRYTKIGRQVTVTGSLVCTATTNNTTQVTVSLPFTASANSTNGLDAQTVGAVMINNLNLTKVSVVSNVSNGSSVLSFNEMGDGVGWDAIKSSMIPVGGQIKVNHTYNV